MELQSLSSGVVSPAISPERLKKRSDFLACRAGRRVHERDFTLQLLKRSDDTAAFRVGFTVTKKVGNAVMRNRIKRRLREIVRLSPWQPDLAGHDMVLIAREGAATTEFTQLTEALKRATKRALAPQSHGSRASKSGGKRTGKAGGTRHDANSLASPADTGQNPPDAGNHS